MNDQKAPAPPPEIMGANRQRERAEWAFRQFLDGHTVREIAEALSMNPTTVGNYLRDTARRLMESATRYEGPEVWVWSQNEMVATSAFQEVAGLPTYPRAADIRANADKYRALLEGTATPISPDAWEYTSVDYGNSSGKFGGGRKRTLIDYLNEMGAHGWMVVGEIGHRVVYFQRRTTHAMADLAKRQRDDERRREYELELRRQQEAKAA